MFSGVFCSSTCIHVLNRFRYMRVLGLEGEKSGDGKANSPVPAAEPVTDQQQPVDQGQPPQQQQQPVVDPVLLYPVDSKARPRLAAEWTAMRKRVAALDPVGRYTVRCIAYRRHLVDEAYCAERRENSGDEPIVPGKPPRCPVVWLFLRPAKYGPPWQLPRQVRMSIGWTADYFGGVAIQKHRPIIWREMKG